MSSTSHLHAEKSEPARTVVISPRKSESKRQDASSKSFTWIRQLNKILPSNLHVSEETFSPQDAGTSTQSLDARRLEKIIKSARKDDNVDFFPWLVENGHKKAAVWLMEAILSLSASTEKEMPPKSPSNLDWPQDLFSSLERSAVDLGPISHPSFRPIDDETHFEPSRFESREAQASYRLLSRVWETLGILVVRSAPPGPDGTIDDNMQVVLLVLGQIHNLGLVPDDVYASTSPDRPSFVQRPPILHLVSSRILTALSDATWRQQQDDAIAQAIDMGMSLKEISENAPGGRFRLKVRPLGPEVWLELILWCCVESRHTSAALAILKVLSTQAENPWFAVRWTWPQSGERPSTSIDWDRVKLRYGGPGGLIEGYSREKPFVDVPDRTISVEVVLTLIEKLIASSLSAFMVNASKVSPFSIHKDFRSPRKTMADIEDVITFLEPHDLPCGYFDYLETRLIQDNVFDVLRAPGDLFAWVTRMKYIRALDKTPPREEAKKSLRLDGIYEHSQLHMGCYHQAMDALVQFGDVHGALAVFNEIQENVDKMKVMSITEFLREQSSPTGADSYASVQHALEFTSSHGQLPDYKLAGFLNLISDTKLIGLGRWLLYADAIDGAMIPERVWGIPCMTAALYKFAAASQDEALLTSAVLKRDKSGRLPTIKMQRALVDANMVLLDMQNARSGLIRLREYQGGGYGLSNVAHLAATILHLESSPSNNSRESLRAISTARSMMHALLRESFSSIRGDFTLSQRRLFKQQVRHILRIFQYFGGSSLEEIANRYSSKFPESNIPSLPARDFNVLLAAAIDARGSAYGKQMWTQFCKDPESLITANMLNIDNDGYDVEGDVPVVSTHGIRPQPSIEPVAASDKEPLQFQDPFFPATPPGSEIFPEDSPQAIPFDTPIAATTESSVEHVPLTIPNLQTLRLIVRAAAEESKRRDDQGLGTSVQKKILEWAIEMFKAFRITDKNVVEQEIQQPLSGLDAEVSDEGGELLEAVQQRSIFEQAAAQDLSVGAPVSTMWRPQHARWPDIRSRPKKTIGTYRQPGGLST